MKFVTIILLVKGAVYDRSREGGHLGTGGSC